MNKAVGNDVADKLSPTFANATSVATGKTERTVERAAARGEALGADAQKIAGHPETKAGASQAIGRHRSTKESRLMRL
jgi:hypothetical protein